MTNIDIECIDSVKVIMAKIELNRTKVIYVIHLCWKWTI